jgi:hypothetical protein
MGSSGPAAFGAVVAPYACMLLLLGDMNRNIDIRKDQQP